LELFRTIQGCHCGRGSCGTEIAFTRGEGARFAAVCAPKKLEDIENDLAKHFGDALSADEKETLGLCRQLRNKVLHSDFRPLRGKLNELGIETEPGGVTKLELSEVTVEEVSKRLLCVKSGDRGRACSHPARERGIRMVLESGSSDDFQKASDAFKRVGE
jgi:hypothetical protein